MSKPQGPFALTDAQAVLTLRNNLRKVAPENKKPAATNEAQTMQKLPAKTAKPAATAVRKLPATPVTAAKTDLPPPVPKRDQPSFVPQTANISLTPPPVPPRCESLTALSTPIVAPCVPVSDNASVSAIPLPPPPPPKAPSAPKQAVESTSARPALRFTASDLAAAKSKGLKQVTKPVESNAKVGRVVDGQTTGSHPAIQPAQAVEQKPRTASAPANTNGVVAGLGVNDELLAKLNRRKTII